MTATRGDSGHFLMRGGRIDRNPFSKSLRSVRTLRLEIGLRAPPTSSATPCLPSLLLAPPLPRPLSFPPYPPSATARYTSEVVAHLAPENHPAVADVSDVQLAAAQERKCDCTRSAASVQRSGCIARRSSNPRLTRRVYGLCCRILLAPSLMSY